MSKKSKRKHDSKNVTISPLSQVTSASFFPKAVLASILALACIFALLVSVRSGKKAGFAAANSIASPPLKTHEFPYSDGAQIRLPSNPLEFGHLPIRSRAKITSHSYGVIV